MGELGNMLYDARRAAGVSLAEVSHATRIRHNILESLESGDWDHLPAPGYVRGFVSDYARFLNLDPTPFIRQFELETGHRRLGNHIAPSPVQADSINVRKRRGEVPWKPLVLIVGVVLLVGIGIWLVVSLSSGGSGDTTPPPVDPIGSGEATSTVSPGLPDADAELEPFTLKIVGVEGGASQVTVVVDGKTAYSSAITGGQTETYQVVRTAEVTAANPAAIQVLQNDTVIPGMVADQPLVLSLPANQ